MVAGETSAAFAIFDIDVSANPFAVINEIAAAKIACSFLSSLILMNPIMNERSVIVNLECSCRQDLLVPFRSNLCTSAVTVAAEALLNAGRLLRELRTAS